MKPLQNSIKLLSRCFLTLSLFKLSVNRRAYFPEVSILLNFFLFPYLILSTLCRPSSAASPPSPPSTDPAPLPLQQAAAAAAASSPGMARRGDTRKEQEERRRRTAERNLRS